MALNNWQWPPISCMCSDALVDLPIILETIYTWLKNYKNTDMQEIQTTGIWSSLKTDLPMGICQFLFSRAAVSFYVLSNIQFCLLICPFG